MTQNDAPLDTSVPVENPTPAEQGDDSLRTIDAGADLRKERLRQGVTLEEVAAATGVRPSILKAIEDNNRNDLPAEVFVRGFIKLFAGHLGLDSAAILEKYGSRPASPEHDDGSGQGPVPDILRLKKEARNRQLTLSPAMTGLFAAALVLAVVAVYFLSSSPAPSTPPLSGDAVVSAVAESESNSAEARDAQPTVTEAESEFTPAQEVTEAALPAASSPEYSGARPRNEVVHEPGDIIAAPVPLTEDVVELGQGQERAVQATSRQPVPSAGEPGQEVTPPAYVLELLFVEDTWLQVTIDNQPPREGLYRKGARRVWTARERIDLFLGNAGGVELIVNNRRLPKPGASGKTKRLSFPRDLPDPRH